YDGSPPAAAGHRNDATFVIDREALQAGTAATSGPDIVDFAGHDDHGARLTQGQGQPPGQVHRRWERLGSAMRCSPGPVTRWGAGSFVVVAQRTTRRRSVCLLPGRAAGRPGTDCPRRTPA